MQIPFDDMTLQTGPEKATKPDIRREHDAAAVRQPRLWRVWLLSAAIAVVAGAIVWGLRDTAVLGAPRTVPWWALAAGFFAAEVAVVHVRFRADAHSFSMSEVAFVVGLFFVSPLSLITAQIVGVGAALLAHRRQPAMKLMFNVAQFTLQAGVGLLVFRELVGADPIGVQGLVAALVATLAALVVGDVLINVAIRLSGGEIDGRSMLGVFGVSGVAVALNSVAGLGVVVLLWVRPGVAWLAFAPAIALYLGYRGYASNRVSAARLTALSETTRALRVAPDLTSAIRDVASRTCALFDAEFTEVHVFSSGSDGIAFRTAFGPEGRRETMRPVHRDTARRVRPSSVRHRDPSGSGNGSEFVVAGGTQEPVRDAMTAALPGSERAVGSITVGNHLGDLGSFNSKDLAALELVAGHLGLLVCGWSATAATPGSLG